MTVRAVGFDLDYTLAVPDRDRETILREAVEATDAPPITRAEYLDAHADHLTAQTRTPVFETLLTDREQDVDAETLAVAYRERVTAALEPVPGVERLLSDLRTSYRIGLLTNGPVVAQREKVERLGWSDAFDAILVSGELPAGKPDRRAFDALVEALGVAPDETAYVGDSVEADVAGAYQAGLQPIQVLDPDDQRTTLDSRAVAHVSRAELVARLPEILADL